MKKNINALCNETYAVAFYTFQNASVIKDRILKIISEYLDIVNAKFTIYADGDAIFKKSNDKDIVELLASLLNDCNFENSFLFQSYNDYQEKAHNIALNLDMMDCNPALPIILPNILYLEFPADIYIYDIYSFMKDVCDCLDIEYACCNPIIAHNQLHYPDSLSMAIKLAYKKLLYSVNNGTFFNYSLLKQLINHKIGTINLIQIFSEKFNIDVIDGIKNYNELYFESGENFTVVSALHLDGEYNEEDIENFDDVSEEVLLSRYKMISRFLKDYITYDYERDVFFKKELWNDWIKRFE